MGELFVKAQKGESLFTFSHRIAKRFGIKDLECRESDLYVEASTTLVLL
jgi:hypothetical protein